MNEAKSPPVVEVSEADFERTVLEGSRQRPVVVDFWAPWCGPCRTLGPMLEKLAAEKNGEFLLAKVNIDEAQRLAMYFRIESIPAVMAFRDGKVVSEFVGVYPEAQLRAFIDQLVPSDADRAAKEAAALEAEQPAEAEARYRRVLEQDRTNGAAMVGLARLLLARNQDDEAAELLGRVGGRGEHGEEAERLEALLTVRELARDFLDEQAIRRRLAVEPNSAELHYQLGCVLAAAGRYPEALNALYAAAERDRKLASAQVREAMVKIFQVVGVRSELADEYRDKLTRLLY